MKREISKYILGTQQTNPPELFGEWISAFETIIDHLRGIPFSKCTLGKAKAENLGIENLYRELVKLLSEDFDGNALNKLGLQVKEKFIIMSINLFRSELQDFGFTISKISILTEPNKIIQRLHMLQKKRLYQVPPIEVFWHAVYENGIRYRKLIFIIFF